jgi:uncharacterized protein (DUF302 family)
VQTSAGRPVRRRTVLAGAALAACTGAACGTGESVYDLAPPARPGQSAGTVVLTASSDAASTVKRLQDAITANGGTVAAVVDHAAAAKAVGVALPANTVVIGGSPGARAPLLRAGQRAGATLPERYLVRQGTGRTVTITYDSADYVAAVSEVPDAAASTALAAEIARVAAAAADVRSTPLPAPLIGVTSFEFLLVVAGDATVATTVTRLRNAVDRSPSTITGVIDLGAATPAPTIRATTSVLVSTPEAEAPLIAAAPTFGLEMPMRYLVWVDDKQITQVGCTNVRLLAARHGLPTDDPNVTRLATDADRLVKIATGTAAQ